MALATLRKQTYTQQEAREMLAGYQRSMSPYLAIFWAQFPWSSCARGCRRKARCLYGCGERGRKLALLRAMTKIKLSGRPSARHRGKIRSAFTREFGFCRPERPCFVCGAQHHHRHHIIQISMGGQNRTRNIVLVCRDCHRDIHI